MHFLGLENAKLKHDNTGIEGEVQVFYKYSHP